VTAAFNVASQADDLIVLVDDADEILGTTESWQLFGEKPDRRHVHQTLELPRVRACKKSMRSPRTR
jgi:PhoPQ-activated pathogenicity-related protein